MLEKEKITMTSGLNKKVNAFDIMATDYKSVESATQENIEFKKVRGSVRLMVGKIKTPKDVAAMLKKFLAKRLP